MHFVFIVEMLMSIIEVLEEDDTQQRTSLRQLSTSGIVHQVST